MSKFLIINADDFGYNQQQNQAIMSLLEQGLIMSTSLMSVAPEAGSAAEYATENDFAVGVHLTINSDSDENKWNSLSGKKSFQEGLPHDGKKLTFSTKRKDVREELEAQYQFLIHKSVSVDHADNHCGTLYGINGRRFYIDAFDFCASHKLPYRFPKTPGFLERQLGNVPAVLKKLQKMIVHAGEVRGVKMLDDLVSNPWSMERIGTYEVLQKYYLDAVDNCMEGVTEMFLHPALPLDGKQGEWKKRVFEYEILKSGCLLERARQKGVHVVSWEIFK